MPGLMPNVNVATTTDSTGTSNISVQIGPMPGFGGFSTAVAAPVAHQEEA